MNNMRTVLINRIGQLALLLTLSACGGGGGGDSSGPVYPAPVANTAPSVNAGGDQRVQINQYVTLSGSATDDDGSIRSYQWNQVAGAAVVLDNTESAETFFIAPSEPTVLEFELTATDDEGASSTSLVTIVVFRNSLPTLVESEPIQAFFSQLVTLSGSASDADGSIASYQWTQDQGEAVELSDPNAAVTEFVAPEIETLLAFSLTVTDNDGGIVSASYIVDVVPPPNVPPSAEAGDNQGVESGVQVNLLGVGTDSDGAISSYLWEQLSGDPVALNSTDTANTSFTAPATITTLEFRLTVTDDEGASTSDTVTVYVGNRFVIVSGAVSFDLVPLNTLTSGLDYSNTRIAPARGLVVTAIDDQGAQLSATTTDNDGEYQMTVAANTLARIRISARILQTTGATYDVQVTDNTNGNALYVVEGEQFNTEVSNHRRDFHMASGWDGSSYTAPRSAGPFAILDAIYETVEKFAVVAPSVEFPALEIRWSENNSTAQGNRAEGDIGTSFYSGGTIYVLGKQDSDTDEYDRHIVIHEWGHYFEDQLSRSDSMGGPHSGGDRLDMRIAFGEGWGNALSGMITDDPFYRDSSSSGQSRGFTIRIESNTTINTGWFNESSVQSVLYDLYDDSSDGADSISLGLGPIYDTLVSPEYRNTDYFINIFPFIDRLKELQPDHVDKIDNLVNGQNISGTGEKGQGETNDGGISSALPVFKTALVNGNPIELCSTDEAGTYNKLANRAYVEFNVASAGSLTFVVSDISAVPLSDPDFLIRKGKSLVGISESPDVGEESATVNFSTTGIHTLEFYDWNNIDEENENAGSTCFNLQITN